MSEQNSEGILKHLKRALEAKEFKIMDAASHPPGGAHKFMKAY